MKSGFGGFKTISPIRSAGKITAVDSFGSLDRAIKTILGDEKVLIYTSAAPETIIADSNNLVSRWNPLNPFSSPSFLTQSVNTNKPTFNTTTHQLGKYGGVYSLNDDTLTSAAFSVAANYNFRTTLFYIKQIYHPQSNSEIPILFTTNAATNYGGTSVYNAAFSAPAGVGSVQMSYFYNDGSGNKNPVATFGGAGTLFFGSGSAQFRVAEEVLNTAARAVTSSFYDSNKQLINLNAASSASAISTNKSSFIFSSASTGQSAAGWDTIFPQTGFVASKLRIGASTGQGETQYYTVIVTGNGSTLTAAQVQSTKVLLDKVYGR